LFSEGSKIKPSGLKNLKSKDKKIYGKISILSDIISAFRIDYPPQRRELRESIVKFPSMKRVLFQIKI